MKGKHVSLALNIAGAVCIAAGFVLNGIFKWGYSAQDIIILGGGIALLGSPVALNLILEKIILMIRGKIETGAGGNG